MFQLAPRLKDYIKSLRGKVIDVKRRPVIEDRPSPMDYDKFLNHQQMEYKVERVIVVEIPEREFDRIAEMRNWYENNIDGYDITRFDKIIKDHHWEKELREEDSRLAELYDQYKVMLTLLDDRQYNRK